VFFKMKNNTNSKKAFVAGISCLVLAVAVGAGIWGSKSAKRENVREKQNITAQNEQTAPVSANKNSKQEKVIEENNSSSQKNSAVTEKKNTEEKKTDNKDTEKKNQKVTGEKPETNTKSQQKENTKGSSTDANFDEEAAAKAEDTGMNPEFALPVNGKIVMDYSEDVPVFDQTLEQYRTNNCISIAADKGEKILAAAAGTVESISNDDENGYVVTVFHGNGWRTTYGQLDKNLAVKEGDIVNKGDLIGVVGEPSKYSVMLGYHMDFGVTQNGESIDPKTALAK
jgi:murein DD-endopeptidase MepM/ murein hydrolase activator NlpD